ncbi:unnamed protein product [Rotaria sp. Silwood2]|nr:unnamed protein product [Rotaria sp. Silwood2]
MSASESSSVASYFAGNGEQRPELESVIFEIRTSTSISPYANIKGLSHFKDEQEFLLTIGSVFRIVNVESFDKQWFVQLALDKSDNRQMEELANYFIKEFFSKSPLLNLARILFQMSEYNRAEQYCIRADKELSSDDNNRSDLYRLLGEIYQNGKGDYQKAEEMYNKALFYSNNLSQSTTIQNHLGLLQNEMSNYNDALKTLENAEELCRKDNLFDNNVIVKLVTIYINMGIVYRHKLNFVKSLEYYNKALDLNLQIRPELHPSISHLYNNIGLLNSITCDYDASLTAYEKALKIQLQILPKIHTDLATVYNNMALVYMATENYSKALENFETAFNMFKELLRLDHPTLATLYHNIGDAYRCLKQYDKAANYLEKGLELRIQKLSLTHAHIAESYQSLGWTYSFLSNHEKALDFCKKALKIKPDDANVYHCMGMIYDAQCDYNNALSALRKAIDYYENFPAKRSIALVRVHKTIAAILNIQENTTDAIKHYNKAIEVYHDSKVLNTVVFIE